MKVVIVGGVAGGATAAARLRRLDEFAEIVLLEKDGYISFANCGLPYYIGGEIAERNALLLQTPESFRERFCVDVRTFSRAERIDTEKKLVRVESVERGGYDESYDALVLCPGATPISVQAEPEAASRIFVLRNLDDTDRIFQTVTEEAVSRAVIVGGGFIGLELAENLSARGLAVRVVEAAPTVWPPFDADMADILQQELEQNGVKLHCGVGVSGVERHGEAVRVVLQNGDTLETDMVISAIGVRPATGFLKGSGIELGPKGHIVVNEHMRTNKPDVYAAGDAVQIKDFVLGGATAAPLAGPANRQARVVADNIAGIPHTYGGVQGTGVMKLFGLTAACVGANERALKRTGVEYLAAVTHPFSHATYYPGAKQMTAKLLFTKEGKILGCQMVGREGVEKRIDVIATAQRLGAHVTQLCDLELAYAPPYSSAKDPVNMLGYVAENMLEGIEEMTRTTGESEETLLLDVRTEREYGQGHLPGAINIPLDTLRDRLDELNKDRPIVEYCQVGVRAHTAYRILKQHGFRVKNLSGGYISHERDAEQK